MGFGYDRPLWAEGPYGNSVERIPVAAKGMVVDYFSPTLAQSALNLAVQISSTV
jgi:hypothetical protein